MALKRRSARMPPTPGEVLREMLQSDSHITQDRLAVAMQVTRYSINQLVNDRRAVTPDMALRLAKALSTSPEFWLDLQRQVDLDAARRRARAQRLVVRTVRDPVPDEDLFYDAST
jgi:addiction module HigA family antidote